MVLKYKVVKSIRFIYISDIVSTFALQKQLTLPHFHLVTSVRWTPLNCCSVGVWNHSELHKTNFPIAVKSSFQASAVFESRLIKRAADAFADAKDKLDSTKLHLSIPNSLGHDKRTHNADAYLYYLLALCKVDSPSFNTSNLPTCDHNFNQKANFGVKLQIPDDWHPVWLWRQCVLVAELHRRVRAGWVMWR